ncbi:hypothetical protein D4R54_01365, partial [archaeon]
KYSLNAATELRKKGLQEVSMFLAILGTPGHLIMYNLGDKTCRAAVHTESTVQITMPALRCPTTINERLFL